MIPRTFLKPAKDCRMAMAACFCLAVVAATAWSAHRVTAQPSDSLVTSRSTEDAMAAALDEQGLRAAVGRVVVHVPAGTLSTHEAQALATTLNRGLDAIETLTHTPHAWQRKLARLDYYFPPGMFVSYTQPLVGRIFISFPRLGRGDAPTLHETVHGVLAPSGEYISAHPEIIDAAAPAPVWLFEGLAHYVGSSVAAELGVRDGDPLQLGALAEIDPNCAKALATPVAAQILPFIGAPGVPEGLISRARRLELAPPFYVCAASFNKYLVGLLGLDAVIDLLPAADSQTALEEAAHEGVAALRADWRKAICAPP
jgi:hypothetical protein